MGFVVHLEKFVNGQGRWEKTSVEHVDAEDRSEAVTIAESRFPGQRSACVSTDAEYEMYK